MVLSISGFDPSSGAGLTADIKTAAAHECYGVGCLTALTVQSTRGVGRVEAVSGVLVRETLESLAGDLQIAAIRIGMLGSAEVADEVADFLERRKAANVVLDPVLASSTGASLIDAAGVEILKSRLLPLAAILTPNLSEAGLLAGRTVANLADMEVAAAVIQRRGARSVLVTGGHLPDNTDVFRDESGKSHHLAGKRIESKATHGTGCALAMAIACNLANGYELLEAATMAKDYVRKAIEAAYPVGKGSGPMNHLFDI
ncbi:MAG TPA: bifunctional hydroxymethylpyrimidine kinase/phosphomethylpyrimidine kinase [Terriglobales bacterium]|nr:bifunctional hydroxymethylpyrimidine kinase/phosphomethylpyrimidine kinase [Terriglobales bacterium]